MRYGMAIDLKRCIGCHCCTIECKADNNLPNNVLYTRVLTIGSDAMYCASGTFPNVAVDYQPVGCQHCSNPPCVAVCPTGASYKRDDGIVIVDSEQCTGCKSCLAVCPYDARTFIDAEPQYYCDYAMGDDKAPSHEGNTVEKCFFCASRIDEGGKPSCMQLCPSRARYWGDLDDPESEVSKAIEGREYVRLLEEEGTEPNVYYLK